jgi:hypothetical protein
MRLTDTASQRIHHPSKEQHDNDCQAIVAKRLADAEAFQRQLRERFAGFNLELAEEKTRLLLFGRHLRDMLRGMRSSCGRLGGRSIPIETEKTSIQSQLKPKTQLDSFPVTL